MRAAESRRRVWIMISSSIRLVCTGVEVVWMTYTSWPRALPPSFTKMFSFGNWMTWRLLNGCLR